MNPYLPNYEYLPDAEPKVFNGRVYLYGSHDRFNGLSFCLNDYVTYSAPIDNLNEWRFEGVIYRKEQDPLYRKSLINVFYASDCARGKDGRYYLYYTLGFEGHMGVARADFPKGPFEFYGHVQYPDKTLLGDKKEPLQFDPAILVDDDGKIYLYSGFAPKKLAFFQSNGRHETRNGAMVMELEDDMKTIKGPIRYIAKTVHNSKGTPYEGHEFFEASSIRKYDGIYYFAYSSINGHELCYATSRYPDRDFEYQGVLVSNCDLGLSKKPLNYPGNNHGGLLRIGEDYYVFYHRQTNRNSFSRQACAEKIRFENGRFVQAEMTSQGLEGPLSTDKDYPAAICCNLYTDKGVFFCGAIKNHSPIHPYLTQEGKDREENPDQYIRNLNRHAVVGYKYFDFSKETTLSLEVRGHFHGKVHIALDDPKSPCKALPLSVSDSKAFSFLPTTALDGIEGIHALYLTFEGKGHFDLKTLRFRVGK